MLTSDKTEKGTGTMKNLIAELGDAANLLI